MGKHRRAKPAESVAVEDLLFAMRIGDAAATGKMPTPNPNTREIVMEDTGEIIRFTDQPLNRGMLAISEQFRDRGHDYSMSLMWRLTLIGEVATDSTFAEWFRKEEVAGSLLEALATFPTNLGRAFNRRALLAEIKRIEKRDAEQQSPS
jgi:hypothetical protein